MLDFGLSSSEAMSVIQMFLTRALKLVHRYSYWIAIGGLERTSFDVMHQIGSDLPVSWQWLVFRALENI